ncbi:hypothetical protein CDC7B_2203 [Corynebacterium diphtheriae C7 (beta)]|nr:hypothetical protein CDC7B_2203 [Corynebacterium diphtheriae C7 (beta)]
MISNPKNLENKLRDVVAQRFLEDTQQCAFELAGQAFGVL